MPLLSEAKTCYVGNQPITKIYAGAQLVWPKFAKAESVKIKAYQAGSGGTAYEGEWCVAYPDIYECANCEQLKASYEFQYKTTLASNFTAWEDFGGYRSEASPYKAYCFLTNDINNSGWDACQVRIRDKKTGKTVETVLDITTPITEPRLQVACNVGTGGLIDPVRWQIDLIGMVWVKSPSSGSCDPSEDNFALHLKGVHNITDPTRQVQFRNPDIPNTETIWAVDDKTIPNDEFSLNTGTSACAAKGVTPVLPARFQIRYRFYTNDGAETVTDWIQIDRP